MPRDRRKGKIMEHAPLLIAALIVLIVLSGLFSATETAYSCLSRIKMKGLATRSARAEKTLRLSEKFESLLTTTLIGNNVVNLSAAAVSGVLFAAALKDSPVDPSVVSTAVLTVVILIVGEITPKFFAKSLPEKMAMALYPFAISTYYILYPFKLIFGGYRLLIGKIFRFKPDDTITDEQLMTIVDEAEEDGTLKEKESDLIRSALEFDDLEVGDILVPRVNVVALPLDAEMSAFARVFRESGYSRLIVYEGSLDNIVGFIHEKDFYPLYLDGKKSVKSALENVFFVAEHTRISLILQRMQARRTQLAVVTDEYGGTLGIVTIEDVLEELVGEIYDEHDEEETPFIEREDGSVVFEGYCDIDLFFSEMGFTTETDANTFGGWVVEQFGEIPRAGREISVGGYRVKVSKATKKCVLQAIVRPESEGQDKEKEKKERPTGSEEDGDDEK